MRAIMLVVGAALVALFVMTGRCHAQGQPPDEELRDPFQALKDEDPQVRFRAVSVLGRVGKAGKFVTPVLRDMLEKDPSVAVKLKVAETLWMVERPPAREIVPVLVEGIRSREAPVQVLALQVVRRIGAPVKEAVPAIRAALQSKEFDVKLQAIFAVSAVGTSGRDAVPELLGILRADEDGFLAANAAAALGEMGFRVVPQLVEALGSEEVRVRAGAVDALARIGPKAYQAVPALTKALADGDAHVRSRAAEALGNIKAYAVEAVPELQRGLKDQDTAVRIQSALALWRVKKEAAGVPALVEVLGDDSQDGTERAQAAAALGEFGAEAKSAAPVLLEAARGEGVAVRREAVAALGRIGSGSPEVKTAIAKLLDDMDEQVRVASAGALWRLAGQLNDRQRQVLAAELNPDGLAVLDALDVVASMGKDGSPLLPEVVSLTRCEVPEYREAAAEAVRAVDPELAAKLEMK